VSVVGLMSISVCCSELIVWLVLVVVLFVICRVCMVSMGLEFMSSLICIMLVLFLVSVLSRRR